jgi:hypothetical protein
MNVGSSSTLAWETDPVSDSSCLRESSIGWEVFFVSKSKYRAYSMKSSAADNVWA